MARARMIAREAVNSGEFYDLPYWAFVLWVGMVTNTDDGGSVRSDAAWLKARFLPRRPPMKTPSDTEVTRVLTRWETHGMVERHQKDGVSYYRLTSFSKHNRLKTSDDARKEMKEEKEMRRRRESDDGDVVIKPEERDVIDRLIHEFGVGPGKAMAWASRFTEADLDAWMAWEPRGGARNPRALRLHLMASHANPADAEAAGTNDGRTDPDELARRILGT